MMLNKYVILTLCSFDSSLHCSEYSYMPRSGSCKNGVGYISLFVIMDAESDEPRAKRANVKYHTSLYVYLRCEASCRTWYNFNQFRFRKEVLYFLIPMSFWGALPPRLLSWTRWGPRRIPNKSVPY